MNLFKKIKLSGIFIMLSISTIHSQDNIDTLDIIRAVKYKTFRLNSLYGNIPTDKMKNVDSIIDNSKIFNISFLDSKGFNNFIFLEIKYAEDDLFEYVFNNLILADRGLIYFEFVAAYDLTNNRVYQLKGYLNNDFPFFFKEVCNRSNSEFKSLMQKKNKKIFHQYFIDNFYVQDFDLNCLIENIENINNWEVPCLRPSPSRVSFNSIGMYFIH